MVCEQMHCTPKQLRDEFSWADIERLSVLNSARNAAQKVKAIGRQQKR